MIEQLIEAADAARVVLVPNAELAAALADAIERAHARAGREIWPTPRVRDFGGWLRDQHIRRQLVDSSLPRCLSDVEERELWREVVLESESGRQFLEPAGAARAARQARRTVLEYGIPLAALEAGGGEEAALFLAWNRRYGERCRELSCVGADRLLAHADEALGNGAAPEIVWVESPLWRPLARRWLERHAGAPLLPLRAAGAHALPRIVEADSPLAELAAMAGWAREAILREPEFRAWICVPDLAQRRTEILDAFDAALAPERFALGAAEGGAPYAVAGGTPLADFAPVRSALELLSASSGMIPFARFSSLLRAPELSQSPADAGAAAHLDVALRAHAPSEAPLGRWLALAAELERARDLAPAAPLRRLEAAWRKLQELSGSHPLSRWLSVWVAAFEAGPWCLRHRWSSGEYQAAERLRELLATLGQGDALFGSRSRASAEGILGRAARETAFQAQTGVPQIWISGERLDPWLAYDGLWVAACDERRWPPPVEPAPLVPVRVQREFGVVGASLDSQLRLAEDLQRRWLERARACVFSSADPEEGRRAVPSPLLSDLGGEPERAAGSPQPHWRRQLAAAPNLERVSDGEAPPFASGEEKTRGVSTLRSQSRCPFRGFAETRLTAERLEEPAPGFNERERGEIVHGALQRIWAALGDSSRLAELGAHPQDLARLVEDSAREALLALCARRDPGGRWRGRELARVCRLLIEWLDLEMRRAPFAVERLDEGAETARHAGVDFTVRIDRIDRLADGARVLIDYKTGAAQSDWRGDRPDNPQLPVYALLHRESLVAVAYGRVQTAKCRFVAESERKAILPGASVGRLEGRPSFAALLELWSQRIERLAGEFAAGRAAVDPTPQACRTCHLHGLCRVPSTLDISEPFADGGESA